METLTLNRKDFVWAKWTKSDIRRIGEEAVALKKKFYSDIKKIPVGERTFENTIRAIEYSDYEISDIAGFIRVHREANTSSDIRAEAKRTLDFMNKKLVDIEYDEGIYRAVKDYERIEKDKAKLKPEDRKLLKDMLLGYKRMGFSLSITKRKKLQNNIKRLTKLSANFLYNINEYKDHILVTREELDGLPERYIRGLSKDKKTQKYKVSLEYPDMSPFMSKARNSQKRKELNDKSLKKGGQKNIRLLNEIIDLRTKNARLLGYKTHADYILEPRMAKTRQNVLSFLETLMVKINVGLKKDMDALTKLKRAQTGNSTAKIKQYDIAYYSDQLRNNRYSIDTELVREYFPIGVVKKGMFEIYQKLFSVRFEKLKGYQLWHKDVELYAVKDKGRIVSYFALDPYPRDGKYGHACAMDIVKGRVCPDGDKYIAPFSVMLVNFQKPTKGTPSLLSHGEVEVFFHEFGHIMHMVLTRAKYMSQSGASTALDFVEAPSQMFENWIWDNKMLNILSEHYKTRKNLPQSLLENMLKAKFHLVYYSTMRQLILALFDIKLHTGSTRDIPALYSRLVKKYVGITLFEGQLFPAGFGHLVGYDAGYYGYMWSKVFASDMFTRFAERGILNKKIGAEYRKIILEKGSSDEEMRLLENFLGRKPNNKAFLNEIGL